MKQFLVFLSLVLFLSCLNKQERKSTYRVIEYRTDGDFFDSRKKSLSNFKNSVRIVYKDDFIMYIEPLIRVLTENVRDDKGEVIDEKVSKMDTTYMIYAIQKGDKNGLSYPLDAFKNKVGIVFNADSVRQDLTIMDEDLKTFNYELGTPNDVLKNEKTLVEKYLVKKINPADADSIYRYYNEEYKDIDFSFSKRLDEESRSKLIKTSYIYNAIPKGMIYPDVAIPKRKISYEIVTVSDKRIPIFEEILEKFKVERELLIK